MAITSKISSAISGGRAHAFLSDELDDIVFDTVLNYTAKDTFQVTSHAIEDGGDVSDHVIAKPHEISFSTVLTDDDFSLLDPTSFFNATVQDRFDILELWRDDKPILTYYGHKTDVENLVLTSVTRNKNLDTGNGWGVDISLVVINVAVAVQTEVKLSAVSKKGPTSKGTSTKAGEPKATKLKSVLKGLFS